MDSNSGVSLLATIWPKIDAALSEETRSDRLRFISDLLRCFENNGTDLSRVLNIDEDIRSCAQHLGATPKKPEPKAKTGVFVFDTSGLDDPVEYEFIGGPFDGTTIRLSSEVYEMPPALVTLAAGDLETRLNDDTTYALRQITDRDPDGNPVSEYLAYEHVKQNGI